MQFFIKIGEYPSKNAKSAKWPICGQQKSLKGGHFCLIQYDFFEYLYFD